MSSKSKEKIRVRFVGNNATNVTGSQILIECGKNKKKILVECGLTQENMSLLKSYQINSKKFDFKPKDINYVFLCHSHIDHIGLVPRLYKENCEAKIIAPFGMKKFYKAMCIDSAKIMERDANDLNKKFKKNYPPIYAIDDIYKSLQFWEEYSINEKIKLDDDIEFRFIGSGHIIGACQLELWIKNGNGIKKIGITSDLGNIALPQYYVSKFTPIKNANLLIGESTYNSVKKSVNLKDREKDLEKIKSVVIQTCIDKKGKILIPTFALARCQSILTYLYDIFGKEKDFNVTIAIDSPLAIQLTNLYEESLFGEDLYKLQEVLSWDKIVKLKEFSETEKLLSDKNSCIFLSCNGMMTAGRSTYVASKLLPSPQNHILFCGYSSEGTLAWKIKQGKNKSVSIDGKQIPCRCNVTSLNSFTSHMQHNELLKYYSDYNFDKIALVHGEFKGKCIFGKELQEEISNKNKTGKVICVNASTEILL